VRRSAKKRWMKIIQKMQYQALQKQLFPIPRYRVYYTLQINTMFEAATRRVHNTFGNRLNYSGNNLPSYKKLVFGGPPPMLSTEGTRKDERSFNAFMFASFHL
jgi:hypothetical protein